MVIDSRTPPSQQDEPGLGSAIRALRDSVEAKLRGNAAAANGDAALPDQLDSLHAALEEFRAGWENLEAQSGQLAQDRELYAELFRSAPDAYVVTDTYGMIREVNLAAQELLRFAPSILSRRPLELFVAADHRGPFRTKLNLMLTQDPKIAQTWSSALGRGSNPVLNVEFTVGVIPSQTGTVRLCWVLRRQGPSSAAR